MPPKTHYLDELAVAVGLSEDLADGVKDLLADYMISRYPDVSGSVPYEEYDADLAGEKVAVAKKTIRRPDGEMAPIGGSPCGGPRCTLTQYSSHSLRR